MKPLSLFSEIIIKFLLLLVSFAPILDMITGIRFIGFSFFITVLPSLILLFLYLINIDVIKRKHHILLCINLGLFTFIIMTRYFIYDEFSLQNLGKTAYMFYIPLCIIILTKFKISNQNRQFIIYLLSVNIIFNFIITLLYILGLPTIEIVNTSNPDYVEFGRFTGIMGGANVHANFVYLIFMIILLYLNNIKAYIIILLFVITLLAVLPSLSKNAIFGIIFIFLYSTYNIFKTRSGLTRLKLFLTYLAFIIIVLFWVDFDFVNSYYISFSGRVLNEELFGARLDKLIFALSTLFSEVRYILFGIPLAFQENSFITISDNSMTLVLAGFGLPFTLFFSFFITNLIKDGIQIKRKVALYSILISIVVFTNNAFLWLPWIVFTIIGFVLLDSYYKINYSK